MQSPIDREISRSHITEIVPFLCFHHFMDAHSLSLSLLLSLSLSLTLSLSLSLSMQSPIDREISISCITEILPFLCFTISQMDIASLSLFHSLSTISY